mmetsp:Transcript_23181/g.65655  ORF Transcript_23181/g.65655 Transcript_23181/m.65655 type:complete len:230 (+) Transcript_23181:346-1035(+)
MRCFFLVPTDSGGLGGLKAVTASTTDGGMTSSSFIPSMLPSIRSSMLTPSTSRGGGTNVLDGTTRSRGPNSMVWTPGRAMSESVSEGDGLSPSSTSIASLATTAATAGAAAAVAATTTTSSSDDLARLCFGLCCPSSPRMARASNKSPLISVLRNACIPPTSGRNRVLVLRSSSVKDSRKDTPEAAALDSFAFAFSSAASRAPRPSGLPPSCPAPNGPAGAFVDRPLVL